MVPRIAWSRRVYVLLCSSSFSDVEQRGDEVPQVLRTILVPGAQQVKPDTNVPSPRDEGRG